MSSIVHCFLGENRSLGYLDGLGIDSTEQLMWWREYKDYRPDSRMIKERVEPGKGIVGCEMHDRQGWGLTLHHDRKPRYGTISRFFAALFGVRLDEEREER